jgi:hypothetical protein
MWSERIQTGKRSCEVALRLPVLDPLAHGGTVERCLARKRRAQALRLGRLQGSDADRLLGISRCLRRTREPREEADELERGLSRVVSMPPSLTAHGCSRVPRDPPA